MECSTTGSFWCYHRSPKLALKNFEEIKGIQGFGLSNIIGHCSATIMHHSIPKPPIPPGNPRGLTRVKLHTVVNLTENEARPVGHLTFVSKRQSAVQMWRDHLQQNALNRARGVEKAKATRQRKKRAKEKKMTLCLYKKGELC